MKAKSTVLLCAVYFCLTSSLMAQTITFRLDSLSADSGQTVDVHIRVDSFIKVTSMQFSLLWEDEALQFISVEKMAGSLNLSVSNFNSLHAGSGKLGFLWVDLSGNGVTLPDSAVLFALRFKVIGSYGVRAAIQIGGDPVPVAIESFNAALNYTAYKGWVLVAPVVGLPEWDISPRWQVYPNPADGRFFLEGSNIPAGRWRIHMLDVSGVRLLEMQGVPASGAGFNTAQFPPGTYWIHGANGYFRFVKRIVIVH